MNRTIDLSTLYPPASGPTSGPGTLTVGPPQAGSGDMTTYDVTLAFPLNYDAWITKGNLVFHITVTGDYLASGEFSLTLPAAIPGDANGYIDSADVSILAQHWRQESDAIRWADGDFNGDHMVNDIDAVLLAANWNPQTANVPEPCTLVLLAGILLLAGLRRRK